MAKVMINITVSGRDSQRDYVVYVVRTAWTLQNWVSHGTTAVTGKTLMIEAAGPSETSMYQTIRRHIQEDSSLQLEDG